MVNRVVKSEEVTENGIVYLVDTFSSGAKVKRVKGTGTKVTPKTEGLTEAEIAQAEMMLMQAEILEKLNQIGG